MPQFVMALALTVLAATPRPVQTRWETHGPAYPLVDVLTAGLDDGTVYAAARDAETGGSALFRAQDGGDHWDLLAKAPAGEIIRRVAVDPADGRRVLALTVLEAPGGRVYRSDDAGASWSLDATLALPPSGDESLFFDPTRPDTAFLVWHGLFRSVSDGPWIDVSGYPPAASAWVAPDGTLFWAAPFCNHIPCYPQYLSNSIFVSNDAGLARFRAPCLRLQAVVYDTSDPSVAYGAGADCADLLKSDDGGRTWRGWDPSGELGELLDDGSSRKLTQLAVDPRSGSLLYGLAAAEGYRESGELLRSRDGGESWDLLPAPDEAGVNAIAVGRSGSLYVGTPSGVFRLGPQTRTVPPRAE